MIIRQEKTGDIDMGKNLFNLDIQRHQLCKSSGIQQNIYTGTG